MDLGNNHSGLPSPRWPEVCRHEVFLSFRGGDVRKGFIEFLYKGLADSGIDTFIDRKGIEIGEDIMPKILQVIRHTEISIPVFSKDFASSKSCLTEVAEMVERKRTVMPIFYDVSPSTVDKQDGSYRKSFCDHSVRGVPLATIDNWKKALRCVSSKRGWELENFIYGEHALIDEVVSTVRQLLRKDDLYVPAHLVGMDHPVQEVMKKLGVQYENGKVIEGQKLKGKRVVGLSGLPGIGKSTLAMVVYNKIHHLFEGKSFLKEIHEEVEHKRLLSLQEYLITGLQKKTYAAKSPADRTNFIKYKFRDQRVLIILDDVNDFKQISSLAGDLSWFGPGSRIIVISTGSNLVDQYSQVLATSSSSSTVKNCDDFLIEKYKLKQMNDDHAFELFHKYALNDKPLPDEFSSLARNIILAAGGMPKVIEAVGSYLRGKERDFWEEALCRLEREPYDEEVKRILKRRYQDLDKYAQQIFLDIACFFVEKDKTIPFYMWKACQYYPYKGIDELHNKSLVKIRENNEFWMHNQLKVLGRDIVKEKNPTRPFKWSRLWNQEDVEGALEEGKVNIEAKVAAVEALSATFDKSRSFPQNTLFCYFSKLRYLKMDGAIIQGCEERKDVFLPRLKWLEWQRCHNPCTLLALDLSELVILDLSRSTSISWQCWRQIMEKTKNLKVLILKDCSWLAQSPVSDALANLERLNLERCSTLPGVGRSISKLKNLVSLNIKFCSFVQELPEDIGSLEALKELYIDGTSIRAFNFPEGSYGKLEILSACNCKISCLTNSIGNLKSLLYLALDENELSELPYSVGLLENLQMLSLRNCNGFWLLPDSIGNLRELQVMDLSDTAVDELPSSVNGLRNLKVLRMAHTFIREFPRGIENLENLEEIDFSDCKSLTGKCDITGLSSLRVLLLGDTDISQVIGTDVQCSYFPDLRLDGRFCNWRDGTSKGAEHWINECEPTSWFEADERPIKMPMMSEGP